MNKKRRLLDALAPLEMPFEKKQDFVNLLTSGNSSNESYPICYKITNSYDFIMATLNNYIRLSDFGMVAYKNDEDNIYFGSMIVSTPNECEVIAFITYGPYALILNDDNRVSVYNNLPFVLTPFVEQITVDEFTSLTGVNVNIINA